MHKVMLVDDEISVRHNLISIIDWNKFNCCIFDEASDGIEAFEKIALNEPDIVITDIHMPGMSGLDLSQKIYENFPHVKVIILTFYADFEYAQTAIQYGVVDYLLKSAKTEKLESALRKAVTLLQSEPPKKEQQLLQQFSLHLSDESTTVTYRNNSIIHRVNEYISKNYQKNIRLSDIANHVFVNSSYLSRLYHQESGHTLTEAITLFRMEKAKKLLLNQKIKTYEIACHIGVEDPAYFSLLFKRYVGCSPTEYRHYNMKKLS